MNSVGKLMIYQEESGARVERDERRMWVETSVGVALTLFLAGYFWSLADGRPIIYLLTVGLIVTGVALLIVGLRRRPVCVIEPDRIGYGFTKGRMWWLDRDRIGLVVVRKNLLIQVQFFDRDGNLFASNVFSFFDPKELRQAFKSAGILVR